MSTKTIRPTSLDGIKRLAVSIKRAQKIKHSSALDLASKAAGFENFRHARHVFSAGPAPKSFKLFITAYWRARGSWENGRETIAVTLRKPLSEIVTGAQLRVHSYAREFKFVGPDHLERRALIVGQREAQERVCQIARTLQFIEATGLLPSNASTKLLSGGRQPMHLPKMDHSHMWFDPASKRFLLTDEPYSTGGEVSQVRAGWAVANGYDIAAASWPGMYFPPGSNLFLVSDATRGVPIAQVVQSLEVAANPILAEPWIGESAPTTPVFISPGRREKLSERKVHVNALTRPRGGTLTVPYQFAFGGVYRRPIARMSLTRHREIASALNDVLSRVEARAGAYNRLDHVRSELDEWVQREYSSRELPADDFHRMYYDGRSSGIWPTSLDEKEKAGAIEKVRRVQILLAEHYADCAPVRDLCAKLTLAIRSIENWKRLARESPKQ